MLIILILLLVAKKSRTFSSFSYSANEQVCRSWKGAQPDSQPKMVNGNIPYHRCHAKFINRVGQGAGSLFFFFPISPFLWGSSSFCEFGLSSVSLASYVKFSSLRKSAKSVSSGKSMGSAIITMQ